MGRGFLYSTSYYFVVAEAEELVDKLYALMNPYDILTNIMQGCGSDRDIKRLLYTRKYQQHKGKM